MKGKAACDILHVCGGKNVLLEDFARMDEVRTQPEAVDLVAQTAREIGFDTVSHYEKLPDGSYPKEPEMIPFEKWDNKYFAVNNKETKHTPIYPHDLEYARNHNEMPALVQSMQANRMCAFEINHNADIYAISGKLNKLAEKIVEKYGIERPMFVLAHNIQHDKHNLHDSKAKAIAEKFDIDKRVNEETAEKFSDYYEKPIAELFTAENKTLSGSTIHYYHAVLSSMLNTAVIWQIIPSNPCERVKPPKVDAKESRYLNEYETADLLAALEDEPTQYKTAVKLLIYTGLRRGELCGLEWQDIDFINNKLSVKRTSLYSVERGIFVDTPKTKKSMRTITLPSDAVEMLKAYRESQKSTADELGTMWKGSNRLFTTWDGAPIHPDTLSGWFHSFIQKKQLPDICLHSLRHTSATLLIAAGTPLKVVSDRLGHGSLTTTGNIYVHAIQSAEAAAAETLSAMIEKGRNSKNRKIG